MDEQRRGQRQREESDEDEDAGDRRRHREELPAEAPQPVEPRWRRPQVGRRDGGHCARTRGSRNRYRMSASRFMTITAALKMMKVPSSSWMSGICSAWKVR